MKRLLVLLCVLFLAAAAVAQINQTLPVGTVLQVKLETALATGSSTRGDAFSGRITKEVLLDGKPLIPIGATVQGRVTQATEPRRISGKPTIGIFPEVLIMPNGDRFMLNASLMNTNQEHSSVNSEGQFKGAGYDKKDLIEIGAGTGGGMLLGGLIGGGKGVLIGATVGGTLTVAHWLATKRSASLPAGTNMVMELNRPMSMMPAAAIAGQ